MITKARIVQSFGVCLSLLLIMAPVQVVHGQEGPEGDIVEEVSVELDTASDDVVVSQETDESIPREVVALPNTLFLPVVQEGGQDTGEVVAAFSRTWAVVTSAPQDPTRCPGGFGLWDDSPGAGVGNESGFLWCANVNALDETVSYASAIAAPGVSTTNFRQLRYRVAVSDFGLFRVRLWTFAGGGACNMAFVHSIPAVNDHSGFVTYSVTLPPGNSICRVQVVLTDDPNALAIGRSSALIDYVQLLNPDNGAVGWQETFTGAP